MRARACSARTPVLFGMTPNQIDAGGPAVTQSVSGKGFVNGTTVFWGATPVPTKFVNAERLDVAIASGLTALCGEFQIIVKNPNGTVSNRPRP